MSTAARAERVPRSRAAPHVRAVRALKPVVFLLSLLPLVLLVRGAFTDSLGANPIEALELRTGHWTLRFLLLTLAITPVRKLTGWSALIGWRRMLGLFTFLYATLHFITYAALDQALDFGLIVEDVAEHPYVTIGFATWLLLIPLAVTSTKGWVRRLGGKRWVALHRLVYVCAIGGSVHYLWAVKQDIRGPLLYMSILALLLGWRLVATRSSRRPAA
ncbi:MAG TPA: protein-methionine-sulfoxide reductase heme-binding subunit MsrQ [Gemmatimonadales bacterium]|nr:protein-methionine-sulfoxide reductase heme-binding subunit MsrQ [Gemmatimonadales bacterium]